mmetsp:Transcript_6212/g.11049  ORF Transcript_6212/g.11049 Transcript_6212/m.11049 type:complete len:447 (-) Transcript_6212:45-1385(-)
MWSGDNTAESVGALPKWARLTFGPLILIAVTPFTSIILSRTVTSSAHDGAFFENALEIAKEIQEHGPMYTFTKDALDPMAWKIIGIYCLIQLLLMRFMPGEVYKGPLSPKSNTPVYTDNCFACYIASFALFGLGVKLELFNGGIAFDYFPQLIASMNLFALVFCAFLYLKGRFFPSTTDSGYTGYPFFDFFWGTELYPRILGWDVKVFTNCRFGMTGWALLCTSFACAQYEQFGAVSNSMMISAALQVIYLAKFHIWERGYMFTIDIMHDRAGYYICWGCLVWVPSLYTAHTAFLVLHPYNFDTAVAWGWFIFGVVSIYLNYAVDLERQKFRAANGKMKIGGKDAEYITAEYTTMNKEKHSSMLLVSGWWGMARKINYTFELCVAFTWSVIPAHPFHFTPYVYFLFLFVLLIDRAWRDDARCSDKYGAKWDEYRKRVPSILIPGVF